MAAQTPPQLPPPDLMIRQLNTPNHADGFFRELVARQSPRFQQLSPIKRGTLYSSCEGGDPGVNQAFPQLYFCSETVPIGSNTVAGMTQSEFVIWNWSSDGQAESTYNAEISQLADSITNPVYARVYLLRRDDYEATPTLPVGVGTRLTSLLGVKITDPGRDYTQAYGTFVGPDDKTAEVEFVILNGQIISAIVINEGSGFTAAGSSVEIIGDGTGATATLIIQPAAAVLTSQKKLELPDADPLQPEFVRVLRVYEVLPGPWLPFTRYDDDLGPIQGRRRAVLNTGQLGGVITPTAKTNYEARDGSSVVSIEIQEIWSDGTGTSGNPTYPILVWDLYEEVRGAVERRMQIVVATGTEVGSFTRNGPFAIRTWFEPYADNPYLLKKFVETWTEVVISDRRVTSEFGGGVTRIDEVTAEPGVLIVDEGRRVLSSVLQTKSPHEQTKRTEQLIVGSWPLLHGFHTDETTGIVVNFTKQVIDEGTPYPGRSGYRGPFIEMQTYDYKRSIQLISAIDPNTIPGEESWPIFDYPISLPPTLLSVEAVWTDVVSKLTNAQKTTANVSVSSGSGGGVIVTSGHGYRGLTVGRQVRNYFLGSPALQAFLVGLRPYLIMPSSGTVVLTQKHTSTTFAKGDDGGIELGDSYQVQVHEVPIRDHIVGAFQIINPTHPAQSTSASATSGGGTIAAASINGALLVSSMEVRMPWSTPSALVPGQEILYDIKLEEQRFGLWKCDRIYVKLPNWASDV